MDLDEETLFIVSQTFKALGDPTRIRILHLLYQKECSVNEIVDELDLGQSTVSDRKSTRLNSSHVAISYAVFCLKKKITFYIIYITSAGYSLTNMIRDC